MASSQDEVSGLFGPAVKLKLDAWTTLSDVHPEVVQAATGVPITAAAALLLAHGAAVNAVRGDGLTPLDWALHCKAHLGAPVPGGS